MKSSKNIDDIIMTKVLLEQIIKSPHCTEFITMLCENEIFNKYCLSVLGEIGCDLFKTNTFTMAKYEMMRESAYISLTSQLFNKGILKITPDIYYFLIQHDFLT